MTEDFADLQECHGNFLFPIRNAIRCMHCKRCVREANLAISISWGEDLACTDHFCMVATEEVSYTRTR
jgi:hypothetical protein